MVCQLPRARPNCQLPRNDSTDFTVSWLQSKEAVNDLANAKLHHTLIKNSPLRSPRPWVPSLPCSSTAADSLEGPAMWPSQKKSWPIQPPRCRQSKHQRHRSRQRPASPECSETSWEWCSSEVSPCRHAIVFSTWYREDAHGWFVAEQLSPTQTPKVLNFNPYNPYIWGWIRNILSTERFHSSIHNTSAWGIERHKFGISNRPSASSGSWRSTGAMQMRLRTQYWCK